MLNAQRVALCRALFPGGAYVHFGPHYQLGPDAVGRLDQRYRSVRTLTDGNCFFRSISFWLTGSGDNHVLLRKLVTDYISQHRQGFMRFFGIRDMDAYLANMRTLTIWATDVEVGAVSNMFNCPVWTYSPYSRSRVNNVVLSWRWGCTKPNHWLRAPPLVPFSDRGLYMDNVHDHYEPVTRI